MSKFIEDKAYTYFYKYAILIYCQLLEQRRALQFDRIKAPQEIHLIADALYEEFKNREKKVEDNTRNFFKSLDKK